MHESDQISVVIPTHNRSHLLKRAVRSVQDQTFQPREIIVVDDGSVDDTPFVLKHLIKEDRSIRGIRHERAKGGAAARNTGINDSKCKYIAFLDDDDTWFPRKLELQIRQLHEMPDAVACTCPFVIYMPFGVKRVITPPMEASLDQIVRENVMGGASTAMCLSTALKHICGFDEHLNSSQDWDLWIRLRSLGEIACCNEVLVRYNSYLNDRITRNMASKYQGRRRMYFKHGPMMGEDTRLLYMATLCYVRSRLSNVSACRRMKYLKLSLKHAGFSPGIRFFLSSFPRILFGRLWGLLWK